jgi:hypothetical protein
MLTPQEKNLRKELKGVLRDMGGFVHSKKPTNTLFPGMTMVCEPTIGRDNTKFYNVSFAWCASHDKFDRKVGELVALKRWGDMETVKLPVHIVDALVEYDLVD